jgi:ribose transport system permease protein
VIIVLAVLLQMRLADRDPRSSAGKSAVAGPAPGSPSGAAGGGSAVPGAPAGDRPGAAGAPPT